MAVCCPSCRKRCMGGDDAWVRCEHCHARFYSLAGGEGHALPRPPRERPPQPFRTFAQAHAPALAVISLVCALGLPSIANVIATFIPESAAALVAMSMTIASLLGGACGAGALILGVGIPKMLGALSLGFAVIEASMVLVALSTF